MKNDYLVISCSLNPVSKSRLLAKLTHEELSTLGKAEYIDLRDYNLPICDGALAYSHSSLPDLQRKITEAKVVLLGVPVYNYDVSAAAKNLVELTGSAWDDKVVGFLCAAGGKMSYMSVMGFANSLMLDFRCTIIPRFVYADKSSFDQDKINDPKILERIKELATTSVRFRQLYSES